MNASSHKVKVNEELLRQYLEAEWKRIFNDPDITVKHAGRLMIDVLKDETKNVVENVLKKFRP